MRKTAILLAFLPTLALAQVSAGASVNIDLPVILPPLVVVSPGIRVVPDCDQEVFYTNGFYYVRHDGGWYRSRSHRGGWVLVPGRGVPPGLARMPPGQYRHWKPQKARYEGHGRDRGFDRGHDRDLDRGGHDRGDRRFKGHGKHKD